MALIGVVYRFNGDTYSWPEYHERLEQFYELNHIQTEPKKRAMLLNAIDQHVYIILRGLCNPHLPKDKTYDELVQVLSGHFVVRKSIFRERVKFYQAVQGENDSIAEWFGRVKELAVGCRFGIRSEKILLDRFVSGLRSSSILDRLCEENDDLTIDQSVLIAKCVESSMAKKIKTPTKVDPSEEIEMCPCCVGLPLNYAFLQNKPYY